MFDKILKKPLKLQPLKLQLHLKKYIQKDYECNPIKKTRSDKKPQ